MPEQRLPLAAAPNTAGELREAREQLEQAEQLRRERKFDRAETICTGLLRRHPDYFGALHTLGLICADRGNHDRAAGLLARAAMLNPRSWQTLTALSGVYLHLNAREAAAYTLEQARKLNARDPAILVTLGEIYREEREYELARAAFQEALDLEPSMEAAAIGLADSCAALGDYSVAYDALEKSMKRGARGLNILITLLNMPPAVVRLDMLAELDRIVKPGAVDKSEFESTTAFIRAAAFDKTKRYAEAWDQIVLANKAMFSRLQKKVSVLREEQQRSLAWARGNSARIASRTPQPISLFILGPSRSGKSSLETLVASFDEVKRGYENPGVENAIGRTFQAAGLLTSWTLEHLPPQFYPMCREIYLAELSARAGSAKVFTNTHPSYIHDATRLAATLPNARFLLVKRNVEDNVLRILMRRYHAGNAYAYDLQTAMEHVTWYHAMMDALAEKMPGIARIVSYEDMVVDPAGAVAVAAELCELPNHAGRLPAIGDDRGCAEPYRPFMAAALA